jgi:hypothetical protein
MFFQQIHIPFSKVNSSFQDVSNVSWTSRGSHDEEIILLDGRVHLHNALEAFLHHLPSTTENGCKSEMMNIKRD